MTHYLGIDIGTFESKGVLIADDGAILATASKPHGLQVPHAGWAEHRPREDWWDDFTFISNKLCRQPGQAQRGKAVGASAIGPCMLPVDADGAPLMNAIRTGAHPQSLENMVDRGARPLTGANPPSHSVRLTAAGDPFLTSPA